MPIDLTACDNASRLLIEAELRVAPGTGGRFQPTGFVDLGPALYKGIRYEDGKPQTVNMLLVESAQSIANRLEEVCLQGEDYEPNCQGIPYVRVLDKLKNNSFLTSSVREPHRLDSPNVMSSKTAAGVEYKKELGAALQTTKARPVHIWKMVPVLFERDPGCVLHGVFLTEIDGRIRLPRLVSGYIEALDPSTANSGGVYRGEVSASENVPYSRQEFTSPGIKASFVIHLGTLRGYNLDEPKRRFLVLWALYKIDRFLHGYLRLRTACEFDVGTISTKLDGKDWKWNAASDSVAGDWPGQTEITADFTTARNSCFPTPAGTTERARLNVVDVVYAVDIKASEALPAGIDASAFNLSGFEGRVTLKESEPGKKGKKPTVAALQAEGELSEEEQTALLAQNAAVKLVDGEEVDNPAHEIVKKVLKKWNDELAKQRKKAGGDDEKEPQ